MKPKAEQVNGSLKVLNWQVFVIGALAEMVVVVVAGLEVYNT
jgi:hypothetical protein